MLIANPSLLITDDDRDFRETLGDVFERRGFHTYLAANGEEALTIVRHNLVHLAVFDLHMPKLTGLEAMRAIKSSNRVLPCILLSAALDDGIVREAKEIEAFGVLRKPVSFQELTGLVTTAMRQTYDWPE
jgi:CheY-like chemotaxis protein